MLKISRGVEHDPEAEPLVESYRDFDLKNRFSFGLFKKMAVGTFPKENRIFRSKCLEDSASRSASGTCSTPLLIFSTPTGSEEKFLLLSFVAKTLQEVSQSFVNVF